MEVAALMADPQSTQPQKPKGVRRTPFGWQAYGRVNGRFFSKRFPPETAMKVLKDWRHDQRTKLRMKELRVEHKRPLPSLPALDWTRLTRSQDCWCYVYFVRVGDRVKIGRATDPGARIRALQTAHPEALSLVLAIPAHAALEAAIHARFAHLKTRGEWFRVAPDLVAFVEAVQSGVNPVALLW